VTDHFNFNFAIGSATIADRLGQLLLSHLDGEFATHSPFL
jgi:hypothetical protein